MKLEKAKKKIGQDIYNKCFPVGQEVPIVICLNGVNQIIVTYAKPVSLG